MEMISKSHHSVTQCKEPLIEQLLKFHPDREIAERITQGIMHGLQSQFFKESWFVVDMFHWPNHSGPCLK